MMMQIEQQYLNLNDVRMSQSTEATVAPPPVVICPTEVDNINITLEKNQQCACKDCGKLFNSVWYLKQHAVKHSNDRPFKCKFCYKTYKFRSNLYQHKCPDRTKNGNLPFNKRLMYRLTVNQSNLFDTRELSLQQTSERFAQSDFGSFFSSNRRSNFTISSKPIEQHIESIDIPIEAITSEALAVKQQIELHEPIAPKRFLEQAVIDNYLQKYRNKLYQCRKCKLQFPTRGYLSRHNAQHNELEQLSLQCEMCPQRFFNDFELRKHIELHSKDSGILCKKCCASFRSMLALRRHRNQSRQCMSSISTRFNNQNIDEYAYIDAIDAEVQMSSVTTEIISDNFDEGRSFIASDKNDDCGDGDASSSADCYQHFSSNLTRSEDHNNESDTLIYENGTKRTITTVKIKLGSTSIVSIMKKNDESNNDKRSLNKNRMLYPELNEATNSEMILEEEPKRQLSYDSVISHLSTNRYNSYISSDRIISSHHSGISGGSNSSSSSGGGGGGSSSGSSATSNNTQANGGVGGGNGSSGGGATPSGESNFATFTFDNFLSSNAGSNVYDSLMLEGGRPLILHSHIHATKVEAISQPVVDLIGCTTQAIRDEINLCETLFTVRTYFLRKIAVYIVYITVLQTVEFFNSICGKQKKLNRNLLVGTAASAAVQQTSTANCLKTTQSMSKYSDTVAESESVLMQNRF
uniref:C2H2-type domain-containing protein n=4 Tax=Wuchereria bancrofti TaxID=6293 RepID=A0AAF5Q3T9_WUCBA